VKFVLNSVLSKAALDRSRATAISTVLVAFYGAIAIVTYNALGDTMVDLFASMPPALAAIYGVNDGTPVGMAIGAVYGIIAPAVVLTYAIGGGTGAAVGEELKGSLDLLLANPLSRTSVAMSKLAVIVVGGIVIAIGTWLGVWAATLITGDGIGDRNMLALTVMLVGFGLMMGTLAMAISGWTGKSALGSGIAAAIAVGSWLLTSVLSVNETFKTIGEFTPWHLYDGNDPMTNGIDPVSLAVMVGLSVVFVFVAKVGLNRRDLRG
jgi:ABC-2 type transport system permease protein